MEIEDLEVEAFIRENFSANFDRIKEETGTGLAPDIKARALEQVIFYWRKLRKIATNVSETEVRLNLPQQNSPAGREYGIEGVVDIVQDDGQTTMYDIKTHDSEYVHTHREDYSQQLNIYAHIWQVLRKQPLNQTSIISTSIPERLKEALAAEDKARIERELERWEPIAWIPFEPQAVNASVSEFGIVVDDIEDGLFAPPKGFAAARTHRGHGHYFREKHLPEL